MEIHSTVPKSAHDNSGLDFESWANLGHWVRKSIQWTCWHREHQNIWTFDCLELCRKYFTIYVND